MDALLTKKKEKKNCTRKEYTYVYTYRIWTEAHIKNARMTKEKGQKKERNRKEQKRERQGKKN